MASDYPLGILKLFSSYKITINRCDSVLIPDVVLLHPGSFINGIALSLWQMTYENFVNKWTSSLEDA
jgi:hypothetical protein